jgi:hypothetical protein
MRLAFLIATMMVWANCLAADDSNPFAIRGGGASLPPLPPSAMDEPLPPSFVENRSLFDALEIVGKTSSLVILRYPIINTRVAASGAAGGAAVGGLTYRELYFRRGQVRLIDGREFKARFNDETSVQLLNTSGKVVWEGDLSMPKVYQSAPNIVDYQYIPPISAGADIGQKSSGAAQSSSPMVPH